MGSRLDLQNILEEVLGTKYVYFQPPDQLQMHYPCILYSRTNANTKFADNNPYSYKFQYQLIVIDKDPDSPILDKVAMLSMCSFDRHYTSNNLNHDVFDLYY